MPKQISEIRNFLTHSRRPDAKKVTILKKPQETKFKIRCSRYLYTLTVKDKTKAERLTQSLPHTLTKTEVKSRRGKNADK